MLIIKLLESATLVYVIMIAARAMMAWIRPEALYAYKKFFGFIAAAVDPLLIFVRRVFPAFIGRVDLSPVIAIVLVETVKLLIIYFINLAMRGGPSA